MRFKINIKEIPEIVNVNSEQELNEFLDKKIIVEILENDYIG
jgi:hypothetical protein